MNIVYTPHLTKPRPEKERGSGYINLSAQARNRKALAEASKCYVMNDTVVVPSWLRAQFEERIGKALPRHLASLGGPWFLF